MVGRDERRSVGQGMGDRMNVRLPHLSKLQWAIIVIVLLFLSYLVLAGVIGGHG